MFRICFNLFSFFLGDNGFIRFVRDASEQPTMGQSGRRWFKKNILNMRKPYMNLVTSTTAIWGLLVAFLSYLGSATQGESLERIERKISRFHEDMCLLSQIQVEIVIENQHEKVSDLTLKEKFKPRSRKENWKYRRRIWVRKLIWRRLRFSMKTLDITMTEKW